MRLFMRGAVVSAIGSICPLLQATPIVVPDVPAYNWYHGCGPTAAASILGYWDLNGYPNLFDASGADVYLTANVQDHISSPEHNQKYNQKLTGASLPDPPDTSIADFFHTSEGSLNYGWSYLHYSDDAFTGFAGYRGYGFISYYTRYGTFGWSHLTAEINAGRPLMFLVDTVGDGYTDHFVPVLGYDDRGIDGLWYGFYTTWSEQEAVQWREFQPMGTGTSWGVGYATVVHPNPEPSSIVLMATGCLCIGLWRRRMRRRG